ncbi:hypothetical protein SUGI_0110950 [Cryptomeria japonica]|uniref:major pollen allergen Bet v 1-D/H-like n=1 Tax=Cryptomeria japonica TaxID=3369 RepID=UPI002408CA28|nr:major pollen allergen Bet v 1-D/H-like [Cryptomeria japonica]GLJ09512.1 hypothetical protein SUGI_0110950 [Cryptomeria japonica]
MVAGSTAVEIVSAVEAKRLWNAVVKNAQTLFPKAAPQVFSSITTLSGNGGVGTINQVNFTPGNNEFSFVKERVDEMDEDKMVYTVSQLEGGMVGKTFCSVKSELKFRANTEGGCVITWTSYFDTLPSVNPDQTKAEKVKTSIVALFKKVDEYLVSNPTLYS